jgi:hypothetical protein
MYRYNMPTVVNMALNLSITIGWAIFFAHITIGLIKWAIY